MSNKNTCFRVCEHCGKGLKAIGTDRKGGKEIKTGYVADWSDRKYHKRCFKEIKMQEKVALNMQFDPKY